MKAILLAVVGAVMGLMSPAQARSLDTIRSAGTIGLCAHPNSLPFASKAGDPPGFQVELGQALAHELGVSLKLDWIITQYQIRSADCDIMMDVIADRLLSHGCRACRAVRQQAHVVQEPRRAYQGRGPGRIDGGNDHRSASCADIDLRV